MICRKLVFKLILFCFDKSSISLFKSIYSGCTTTAVTYKHHMAVLWQTSTSPLTMKTSYLPILLVFLLTKMISSVQEIARWLTMFVSVLSDAVFKGLALDWCWRGWKPGGRWRTRFAFLPSWRGWWIGVKGGESLGGTGPSFSTLGKALGGNDHFCSAFVVFKFTTKSFVICSFFLLSSSSNYISLNEIKFGVVKTCCLFVWAKFVSCPWMLQTERSRHF